VAYPQRLLAEDEEVALDLHPHWKVLIGPGLWLLLIVGLASFFAATMPAGRQQGLGRLAVLAIAGVLLGALVVLPWLRWLTTHFVITTSRVVIRTGILARRGRDIPLSRVNDVTFSSTVFERLLHCGTLVVESAGERGQVTLTDVPQVEEVQRELYRLVEADDARRRG
jgi:uncharacterized membrane protein YdbT with pleckstrin-like domain